MSIKGKIKLEMTKNSILGQQRQKIKYG